MSFVVYHLLLKLLSFLSYLQQFICLSFLHFWFQAVNIDELFFSGFINMFTRVWLMKSLFYWIWNHYLWNQGIWKWQPVVLKLVILNYFENIEVTPTISIQYEDIHRICGKVFCRKIYRRNIVKMEKIECRYYM